MVYSALWDRSAVLKYGLVTRLADRQEEHWLPKKKSSEMWLRATIRLRSVDRNYDDDWELQKGGKEITIGFMDRLLVVPRTAVPATALKLLEGK